MFNKYNSVSSQFNNHSRQYMWPQNQFQDLMCKKKYKLVSLNQLNRVNNTDTVIDLNLSKNHLIDQPFMPARINKGLFQQQVPFIMASWKEKLVHL